MRIRACRYQRWMERVLLSRLQGELPQKTEISTFELQWKVVKGGIRLEISCFVNSDVGDNGRLEGVEHEQLWQWLLDALKEDYEGVEVLKLSPVDDGIDGEELSLEFTYVPDKTANT